MSINISKIKSHVYVKNCGEAVRMYKDAFNLDEKEGERILDNDGVIWHCVLLRNGEEYISLSEDKYLPDTLMKDYPNDVRPPYVIQS